MRVLLGDVSNYKKNMRLPIFNDLAKDISEFLLNLVCELQFKIKMDDDPFSKYEAMEFEIDYLGTILTSMEGMFSTIASITNFLMQFIDDKIILG
jgi:hypothetical protein